MIDETRFWNGVKCTPLPIPIPIQDRLDIYQTHKTEESVRVGKLVWAPLQQRRRLLLCEEQGPVRVAFAVEKSVARAREHVLVVDRGVFLEVSD